MDETTQSALRASASSLMSMREALNLALDQAMAADDRVFLLGEDIADPGASGPTAGLSTSPRRSASSAASPSIRCANWTCSLPMR